MKFNSRNVKRINFAGSIPERISERGEKNICEKSIKTISEKIAERIQGKIKNENIDEYL